MIRCSILNVRVFFSLAAIGCFGLIVVAIILENIYLLDPCPLCMLQRVAYAICGFLFLLLTIPRIINSIRASVFLNVLSFVFAIIGLLLASRQVWLQHLPLEQVPSCMAGLDRMLATYPLLDVLIMSIKGTGECATVDFTIFGLSLAAWSIVCFAGIALVNLIYIKFCRCLWKQ